MYSRAVFFANPGQRTLQKPQALGHMEDMRDSGPRGEAPTVGTATAPNPFRSLLTWLWCKSNKALDHVQVFHSNTLGIKYQQAKISNTSGWTAQYSASVASLSGMNW
jgi:hypothetical protein